MSLDALNVTCFVRHLSCSLAPLYFARDAITIAVHLRGGTMLQEVAGLGTGSHLRALGSAIASKLRVAGDGYCRLQRRLLQRRLSDSDSLEGRANSRELLGTHEVAPTGTHVNADVRVPVQHLGELLSPAEQPPLLDCLGQRHSQLKPARCTEGGAAPHQSPRIALASQQRLLSSLAGRLATTLTKNLSEILFHF